MKRCPLCARSYPDSERFCAEHAILLQDPPDLDGRPPGELTYHVIDHRYQLGGLLGRGGMGTVYHAKNLRIGLECAVKVLLPDLCCDTKMTQRLFREIQACSQIHHPNVVTIFTYGLDERAGAYLVMEYLTGRNLDGVITDHGCLPLPFCIKVMLQLCTAMETIHGQGIIHSDLKPSNIYLLPDGTVKVLDFGLVKPFDPESAETFLKITTGSVAFGTPQYMAPEQVMVGPADPRSDIYSLGIILYEMLLGRPPFEGKTPFEMIEAHRKKPPPMPSKVNPKVVLPTTVEVLLLRMLNKEASGRPASATELAEALETVAEALGMDLGVSDLGQVATGDPPEAEPTQPMEMTIPLPAPTGEIDRLRDLALEHRDKLIDRVLEQLRLAIPRYRALQDHDLRTSLGIWFTTLIDHLGSDEPATTIPEPLERLIRSRTESHFSATELLAAFWLGWWACRPLIREVAADNLNRYAMLEDAIDQRILPFYIALADRYVAQFNASLGRKNKLLEQQNDELRELRYQLDDQLRRTQSELVEATRIKARVADAISTGLILVGAGDQRIRLFNQAMEKLSGVRASEIMGRPIHEIIHLVEGVPFDEFIEQVRLHGQVGLRKLRIRFPNGKERTVYVRGQPFFDSQEKRTGVLFMVEDVTERETIIESFSRYVSKDVAQRILRQGDATKPRGEPRQAVLMAVGICSFHALLKDLAPEHVVELLDQHLRLVGNSVFQHGGEIDSVVNNSVLVYFANPKQDPLFPVRSAVDLCRRLARLNTSRERDGRPSFQVGIALHSGQVLLVNVGGKRRMVHTVLGEPAELVRTLQETAEAGQILVTDRVADGLGGKIKLEEHTPQPIKETGPVRTLRVAAQEIAEAESGQDLDPPTLT